MTVPQEDSPVVVVDAPPAAAAEQKKDVTTEKNYWNSFYSKFQISHPSQFCVMTAIETDRSKPIVEFGCGNGRDSIYMATHGYKVYGCDLSPPAIESNKEKSAHVESVDFTVVDASDADQVREVVSRAREENGNGNVIVYTRFFLHSIDETQEGKFFSALSNALVAGDKLYFEFRSKMDSSLEKVHGKDHYRRYIDTPIMMKDLSKLGFQVDYEITGRGMAKYKEEDPYVSRLIATKE